MMTQSLAFARFYEATKAAGAPPKLAANWLMGEVSRRLNTEGLSIDASPVAPDMLAKLIQRIADGTVSNNGARQVFDALWTRPQLPPVTGTLSATGAPNTLVASASVSIDAIIEAKGLKQMNDTGALEAIVDEVLAANQKSVDEYRAGKDKAFNALVGQVMKASKGKANPAQASELLKKKLG
jgi:aspartyl-tRNA(Asn)/glutamyl-tRNA(Gln) amidotransferase subunit B